MYLNEQKMPIDQRFVRVLRDTACSQLVLLASSLPFSEQSACGFGSVLRGIEMGYIPCPSHRTHIQSDLVTGFFSIAVCAALPIQGIVLLWSVEKVAFILDKDVLVRRWSPLPDTDADYNVVYQVVVPAGYRQHVLSVAHESKWSGHLGVTKCYQLILKHFFWPGLKGDVAKFCRSCHVCQVTGKPNQTIPDAPLHPIPVIEPFEPGDNRLRGPVTPHKKWKAISSYHYVCGDSFS